MFLMNVSAHFNVFESALNIEIQFLMNVSAHLMVFEINMHVNIPFLVNVLANFIAFDQVADITSVFDEHLS